MTRTFRDLAVISLLMAACGGGDSAGVTVRIELFQVDPATVAPGAQATLSWTVVEAESVSIGGGGQSYTGLDALGTQVVLVPDTTTFTLTATDGGGEVSAQATVTVDSTLEGVPPSIESFSADPDTVDPGGSATLSWTVTGASSLKITGGEGDIALEDEQAGEREVTPAADTAYTLEATGPGGTSTETVQITVRNPTIEVFTATPAAAREGQPIRLEWTTTNADVITIEPSPDAGRDLEPQDAVDVYPSGGETTYTLTAANSAGGTPAVDTVDVSVHTPPQIVSFTLTPDTVRVGEPVFLAWQTIGVTEISIEGLPEGTVIEPDRVQEVDGYPVIAVDSATYRMVATGPGGEAEAEASLTVHEAPVIDRFEADPGEIPLAGATTLRWATSNAETVRITPPVGEDPLPVDGSTEVSPAETTNYRITAIGPGGEEVDVTEVVVHPPPVIDLFEATPLEVPEGGNVTLRWATRDATSLTLDPDLAGNFPAQVFEGVFGVQPGVDTTYTLTAISGGGEVEAEVSVTVLPRPVVTQFRIEPNEVTFGEEVTLSWATENATSIEIGPGLDEVDAQTLNGEHTFRPSGTGSFILSALGRGGRSEAQSVRVTVHPRPVIRELAADPGVILLGGESTLSWEVDHALRVWFDPGPDIDSDAFEGMAVVRPRTTAEYVLHAESGHGEVRREVVADVTVTVNQPPALIRFSAEPPNVLVGGATTLHWELTDADDITIIDERGDAVDLGDAGDQPVGSVVVDDIRRDRGFTLSASGPGGDLADDDEPTVQVTVQPARLVVSEVFFDRPNGTDRGWEWVELYNPTDVEVPLAPYSLGIGTDDWRASSAALDGTLPALGCIVIGGPNTGADNHDPEFDIDLGGNGFSPTLADEPTGVVAIGVHFMPQFFLPADDLSIEPLDAVLYGWRNSPGFLDHRSAGQPAEVTFQLYELNGDGTIRVDGGDRVRRIDSGWSIARSSPWSDLWLPQDTPTPGLCFEDRPRPGPGWCQIQHPVDPVVVAPGADTPDLFGRVYKQGVTEGGGQGGGVHAQVGFGPPGTHPGNNPFWTWTDAAYRGDLLNDDGQLNDDEYVSLVSAPEREGDYAWAYRFRSDDEPAEWLYCDLPPGNDASGGEASGVFDPATAGVMTVLTVQAP